MQNKTTLIAGITGQDGSYLAEQLLEKGNSVYGVLFNHESPRRGETFVTRHITRAAGRIKADLEDLLVIGNLDAKRNRGYAPEYIDAMWPILQQDHPHDYVCATNETHTVREFIGLSFRRAGMGLEFQGEGVNETGVEKAAGKTRVTEDSSYFHPIKVDLPSAAPSKPKPKAS